MGDGFQKDDQGRLLPLGDGDLHPGKFNLRLLQSAMSEVDRPENPRTFEIIESQMFAILARSDNERNKIAAARMLEKINANRRGWAEHMRKLIQGDTPLVNINVNGHSDKNADGRDTILEVAADLGIEADIIEAAEAETDSTAAGDAPPAD